MPSKVPRITGEEAVRAFSKDGFILDRIRGSHHILRHLEKRVRLSIPVHKGQTVGIGLLRSQIVDAGLTVEEFYWFVVNFFLTPALVTRDDVETHVWRISTQGVTKA